MASRTTKQLLELFTTSPLSSDYGVSFAPAPKGRASASMRIESRQTQSLNRVHGGVVTTLADTAATYAGYSAIDRAGNLLTLSISMSFVSGAIKGETLRAKAEVQHLGKRTVVAHVAVRGRSRRLVASGTFTMLRGEDGKDRAKLG
jgi:uncharacterized protein (TIGR00369 family)